MNFAQKYYHRSPRYVLRPGDSKIIKFAPMQKGEKIRATEILNISETGLAFHVSQDTSPHIGELIKIEFHVPGTDEPIAWVGKVIRLQHRDTEAHWHDDNSDILVAVQFHNLPAGHLAHVHDGLKKSFRSIRQERRKIVFSGWVKTLRNYLPRILLVGGAILALLLSMYLITKPNENYNPQVPTPWGDRAFGKHQQP